MKSRYLPIVIRGAWYAAIAIGITRVFQFFMKFFLARIGVESLGAYNLVTTSFQTYAMLFSFGIPFAITRYVSIFLEKQQYEYVKKIISAGFTLLLLISCAVAIISIVVFQHIPLALSNTMFSQYVFYGLAFAFPFGMMTIFAKAVFIGKLLPNRSFFFEFVESIFRIVLFGFLLYLGLGAEGGILAYAIAVFLTGIYAIGSLRPYLMVSLSSDVLRQLFHFILPVSISELLVHAFGLFQIYILHYASGIEEVGLYTAAVAIAGMIHIIPQILLHMFLPVISRVYASGKSIQPYYRKITIILFLSISVCCLMFLLFSSQIMIVIFGESYERSARIANVLIVAYGVYAIITWAGRLVLDMMGRTGINLMLTLIRVVVAVCCSILFVPSLGGIGIAYSYLIGVTIEALVCLFMVKKIIKIQVFMKYL